MKYFNVCTLNPPKVWRPDLGCRDDRPSSFNFGLFLEYLVSHICTNDEILCIIEFYWLAEMFSAFLYHFFCYWLLVFRVLLGVLSHTHSDLTERMVADGFGICDLTSFLLIFSHVHPSLLFSFRLIIQYQIH